MVGTTDGKPMCTFGASCYRKNEEHLQQFFHPSAADTNNNNNNNNTNSTNNTKEDDEEQEEDRKNLNSDDTLSNLDNNNNGDDSNNDSNSNVVDSKTICSYGNKCYRINNPQHVAKYSHPHLSNNNSDTEQNPNKKQKIK